MNNVKSIFNIGFISIYGRTIDIIADIWKFEIENSKMFMMRNKNIGFFWLMHTKFQYLVSSDIYQCNSYLRMRRCVTIFIVTI